MSTEPTVASLLANGRWCSGPVLAARLGVSRAAVSARVRELRALGLEIYSVAGKGYRLQTPLELLDATALRAALTAPQSRLLADIAVLERVDSTNAELTRRADGQTRACLAEYQSAGRGRAQRAWVSPFGANLYLSLGHDLGTPQAPLGALSLAIGVAIADSLIALGARSIALKWPNDLWADGAKLGGILIEHRGEAGGGARLVIGVGLNVAMQAPQAVAIDQDWTRLVDHLRPLPGRNRLAARVLGAVIDAVVTFEASGFEPFHARWPQYDLVRDRPVRLIESHGERIGVARGIAADGSLQVEINGRLTPIYSGDVSLRVAS